MTLSPEPADGLAPSSEYSADDAATTQDSSPQSAPGAAHTPVPRRHRLLFWTAVLAAVAMVAGGSYLAVTAYVEHTAPEQVVREYLEAIARGDAAAALAYGSLPDGERGMLTEEMLSAQLEIAPMSRISVTARAETKTTATAQLSYQLGFAAGTEVVDDSVTLTKVGRRWQLDSVAVPVTIRLVNGRNRATLAGADIPDLEQLAFPGALPVVFDNPNMELREDSRVVRFTQPADQQEVSELSAAGEAAVGAAVDAALAACLTGAAEVETLCPRPADDRSVPGSLRGTVVKPVSQIAVPSLLTDDGVVNIQAQVTVTGDYDQLDFNNQRVQQTGEHVVNLLASCNVTAPDLIVWSAA